MGKFRVYLLGLVTLLMIPFAWLLQGMPNWIDFFKLSNLFSTWSLIGVEFGCVFALIMIVATGSETAQESFQQQIQLVQSLNLKFGDAIFLSLCAGLGEEFLFRIALQEWFHPLIVSVFFVAIHGYIRPKDWNTTRYGLLVLAFIIVLGYAVKTQGIWFCIFAHAGYDCVLFMHWRNYKSAN